MVEVTKNLQNNNNPESEVKPDVRRMTDEFKKVSLEEKKDFHTKAELHKSNNFGIVGMR